jgi:uncharacterized membrane protein
MNDRPRAPPDPAEEQNTPISDLHAQHYQKATAIQRLLDGVVVRLSHPALLVVLTVIIVGWIGLNLAIGWAGAQPLDPPPFLWLESAASIAAVYIAALILTTQNREDGLTRHRDQLTLELAIVSEHKSAKIIELLEELRRDSPLVHDRIDDDATALARPADPGAVLSAIEKTHQSIVKKKG